MSSKRDTIEFMESLLPKLTVRDMGAFLLIIASEWVTEGELERARNTASQVTDFYLDNFLEIDVRENGTLREAVAVLIEAFGVIDFKLLRSIGVQA